MISKLAMGDIEALRADGIDVPPRVVVRLNALGLKVERAARSAEFVAVPRLAFLGDVAFREPTIGDEEWLAVAGLSFDLDDGETETLVLAACLSTPARDLPDPRDRRAVAKLLKRFRKGPVRGYTRAQLAAALEYAMYGDDAATGELPPPRDGKEEDEARTDPPPFWAGVLRDGMALRLGTPAELRALTASQLHALVQYKIELRTGEKGGGKAAKSTALGDYMRTLEEVRGVLPESKQIKDEHREENRRDDDSDPESAGAHIVSGAAHDGESIAHG